MLTSINDVNIEDSSDSEGEEDASDAGDENGVEDDSIEEIASDEEEASDAGDENGVEDDDEENSEDENSSIGDENNLTLNLRIEDESSDEKKLNWEGKVKKMEKNKTEQLLNKVCNFLII